MLRIGAFGRARLEKPAFRLALASMVSFSLSNWAAAADAGVSSNTTIESLPQEQLFGAEVQYFRLRGGEGPNVPREKVEALWGKVLDAAKDAGMNMISFYIPWDFQ